jgi:hypothetical protein
MAPLIQSALSTAERHQPHLIQRSVSIVVGCLLKNMIGSQRRGKIGWVTEGLCKALALGLAAGSLVVVAAVVVLCSSFVHWTAGIVGILHLHGLVRRG